MIATHVGVLPRVIPWDKYECDRCGRHVNNDRRRKTPATTCQDCMDADGEFWRVVA